MSKVQIVAWVVKTAFSLLVYGISFLTPRSDRLVMCIGDSEGRFAENPKYVYLELLDGENFEPVWLARSDSTAEQLEEYGLPVRRRGTYRAAWTMLRVDKVILSHDITDWEYIGGATVVQTWHGNALKRLGSDTDNRSGVKWRIKKRILRNWDYFVVTGRGIPKRTFMSAFNQKEDEMLVTGYPRNDALLQDIEYSHLDGLGEHSQWQQFLSENRCILYMPTWRRGHYGSDGESFANHGLDWGEISAFCEEKNVEFLLKLHPSESESVEDHGNVHVLSDSVDVYDLLPDVDILITDYSSVYFDYLLVDNPIVFYPYDLGTYSDTKGFYLEYDEATPGPKAMTQVELLDHLTTIIAGCDEYSTERSDLRAAFYDEQDGNSASRLAEALSQAD